MAGADVVASLWEAFAPCVWAAASRAWVSREAFVGMTLEGGWTRNRQRNVRRDSVPMLRLYLTLGGGSRD